MPDFVRILNGQFDGRVSQEERPVDIPSKGVVFKPFVRNPNPSYDPLVQKLADPVLDISGATAVESRLAVDLSPAEIDLAKERELNLLESSERKLLLTTITLLENEIRELRTKMNQLIDATGQAGTVTKFTNGEANQVTKTQLRNRLKTLL